MDGGPLSGKVGIKSIAFSKDGNQYLLNSMDRAIRIYNVDDNSFSMKFCVTVDQFQWKVAQFYGDDYVISCMSYFLSIFYSFLFFCLICTSFTFISSFLTLLGSSETSSHKIHIWGRHFGQLVTILEGIGKHTILDMIVCPSL